MQQELVRLCILKNMAEILMPIKKKTTVVETELDNAIQKIIFSLNTLK